LVQRPIERAWDVQQQWSAAANDAHKRIDRFRRWNLIALVAAAVAGALGGVFNEQSVVVRAMAVLAAALLGFGGLIQQRVLSDSSIEGWLRTRDASERLKSEVWRLFGLGEADDPDATETLLGTINDIQIEGAAFAGAILEARAPTKPLPAVSSINDYRLLRAEGQATWHRGRVATLRRKAKRLRHAELGITLVGIVVSATAAAAADVVLTPIVSALTTVAAVIAAHLSASKYERIAAGYALTAIRLETLLNTTPQTTTTTATATATSADTEFVNAVERILAEQNAGWISLLSED
jgi:hypothetical protein